MCKAGKRETVEEWMKSRQVPILRMQETHISENSQESRQKYTWYFGGSEAKEKTTKGVGFVVDNKWKQYVKDIKPKTDRIISMTLRAKPTLTIICAYAPPSTQEHHDAGTAEAFYKTLQDTIREVNKAGPWMIIGDFNAKIQECENEEEENIFGAHTFGKGTPTTWEQTAHTIHNREVMVDFCTKKTI